MYFCENTIKFHLFILHKLKQILSLLYLSFENILKIKDVLTLNLHQRCYSECKCTVSCWGHISLRREGAPWQWSYPGGCNLDCSWNAKQYWLIECKFLIIILVFICRHKLQQDTSICSIFTLILMSLRLNYFGGCTWYSSWDQSDIQISRN